MSSSDLIIDATVPPRTRDPRERPRGPGAQRAGDPGRPDPTRPVRAPAQPAEHGRSAHGQEVREAWETREAALPTLAFQLPQPLPGRSADPAFIRRLSRHVASLGGVLHHGDEAELRILLVNPRARALFSFAPKRPKIYLACDATRFEAMHEYFHLMHYRDIGRSGFLALTSLEREQEAFNRTVRSPLWETFSQQERQGAVRYLQRLGGDAVPALSIAKDQADCGRGGIDFVQATLC